MNDAAGTRGCAVRHTVDQMLPCAVRTPAAEGITGTGGDAIGKSYITVFCDSNILKRSDVIHRLFLRKGDDNHIGITGDVGRVDSEFLYQRFGSKNQLGVISAGAERVRTEERAVGLSFGRIRACRSVPCYIGNAPSVEHIARRDRIEHGITARRLDIAIGLCLGDGAALIGDGRTRRQTAVGHAIVERVALVVNRGEDILKFVAVICPFRVNLEIVSVRLGLQGGCR